MVRPPPPQRHIVPQVDFEDFVTDAEDGPPEPLYLVNPNPANPYPLGFINAAMPRGSEEEIQQAQELMAEHHIIPRAPDVFDDISNGEAMDFQEEPLNDFSLGVRDQPEPILAEGGEDMRLLDGVHSPVNKQAKVLGEVLTTEKMMNVLNDIAERQQNHGQNQQPREEAERPVSNERGLLSIHEQHEQKWAERKEMLKKNPPKMPSFHEVISQNSASKTSVISVTEGEKTWYPAHKMTRKQKRLRRMDEVEAEEAAARGEDYDMAADSDESMIKPKERRE